jgi:hypothetical protein
MFPAGFVMPYIMFHTSLFFRRSLVLSLFVVGGLSAAEPATAPNPDREWYNSLPTAPKLELKKHGLVAKELRRWKPRGAGQGVAVDENFFYGIGNFVVGKYHKKTGERVGEWIDLRGGATTHMNSGYVEEGVLVLAHSNYPNLPMTSSVIFFDTAAMQPIRSHSLGVQPGSLTWCMRKDGYWWACFANYNERGGTPGRDNRFTYFGKFNDQWQMLESWIFPPTMIEAFGKMSSSGGAWGDDGFLYVTGHDAPELYVLKLPKMGSMLETVTVINVPFEGQAWAWDRSEKRVIYGITRNSGEVVVAQIPEIPESLGKP